MEESVKQIYLILRAPRRSQLAATMKHAQQRRLNFRFTPPLALKSAAGECNSQACGRLHDGFFATTLV